MYRAFLSHAQPDKPYVDTVAQRLTRARIIYDVQSFAPGIDFRQSIREGLDRSSLFVLFASSESLKSTWVRFEIGEAERRRLSGKLQSVLVFIIDRNVTVRDLPEWMQRGRVLSQTRPTQAARVILSQLIYQTGAEQQSLFFGREGLLEEIAQELVPSGGQRVPQVIVASGLDGVGRRSALTRALRDNLSLEFGPVILLEETDALDRLYLLLLEETMVLSTRAEIAKVIAQFRAAGLKQRASLISEEIGKIGLDNVATVIVDEGALTDADGRYQPAMGAIFERLGEDDREPYLVLIQRRRPYLDSSTYGKCKIASFSVPPLDLDSTKRFLVQSFKAAGLPKPTAEQIDELGPYLGGYPPAVSLAVGFSKAYGLGALLADKSILVDFKVRTFSRIVERLGLSAGEQSIAKILGLEPSLSIDVLSAMTDSNVDEVARQVRHLIDHSLVVHAGDRYSLASPIRETVYRTFGLLSSAEFSQMAAKLKAKYWAVPEAVPPLDAIDATIYTLARGGVELSEFADIILPSTLLKIANDAYNQRQWSLAKDFSERAVSADPSLDRARSILCKSLVRLAHEGAIDWNSAETAVEQAEKKGIRGRHFLRGFLERKRGNLVDAVKAYYAAERAGDTSVSVYRDRAQCLFWLGQIDEADRDIKLAHDRYPRNNYIVDLAAQIAIVRRRFGEAEGLVNDLESIDVRENFHHRRATLRAAKKQFHLALEDAETAIRREPPLHEIFAQYIDILIELERYADAERELAALARKFRGRNARDIQHGLRCKLQLRQGNWREAEAMYQQLHLKELPVHRALRREILRQKIQDARVIGDERHQAKEELTDLESSA